MNNSIVTESRDLGDLHQKLGEDDFYQQRTFYVQNLLEHSLNVDKISFTELAKKIHFSEDKLQGFLSDLTNLSKADVDTVQIGLYQFVALHIQEPTKFNQM